MKQMKEIKFNVVRGCWVCYSHKTNSSGYPVICIKGKQKRLARFIFFKMRGRWPLNILRHSCDNRLCINPKHLIEGSRRQNSADAVIRKRFPVGEKHWMTSLSKVDVLKIFKSKESSVNLAKKYGVHRDTINNIKSGRTWSWITIYKPRTKRYGCGEFLLSEI
jgi:hypothetical protein